MIEWKDQFSVKNEELDMQHQKLFVLVNHILESMKTEKANDTTFINDILNQLYDYTQYHFKAEEKKFSGTQYPFSAAHVKAHRDFTDKVREMAANKEKTVPALNAINIAQTANKWIMEHVIRFDKGYSQYIN
ncbi:MAG: bacteriohemerythrin [Spirochaetia bacterium]|nr:bacteriohemerythrin [Spirochaetia bacterium]